MTARRLVALCLSLCVVLIAVACASDERAAAPSAVSHSVASIRVLMLTATAAFRHVGAGRAYYNALGHFSETWTDPRFQRQLMGAIRWAAGRV